MSALVLFLTLMRLCVVFHRLTVSVVWAAAFWRKDRDKMESLRAMT